MKVTSVEDIQDLLGWADVREQQKVYSNNGQEWAVRVIEVVPTNRKRPSILFCFDDAITRLDGLEFSGWHSHYDEMDEALLTAEGLIQQRLCVLEGRDQRDRYLFGQLCEPTVKPRGQNGTAAYKFVRVFFDRDPIEIPYTDWLP